MKLPMRKLNLNVELESNPLVIGKRELLGDVCPLRTFAPRDAGGTVSGPGEMRRGAPIQASPTQWDVGLVPRAARMALHGRSVYTS